MLIRDLNNTFFFTTSAFYVTNINSALRIISNNYRETGVICIDDINPQEAMDHIYKCYKRDDRCCDLNDLKKDKANREDT